LTVMARCSSGLARSRFPTLVPCTVPVSKKVADERWVDAKEQPTGKGRGLAAEYCHP
jgi:hypothetical protein